MRINLFALVLLLFAKFGFAQSGTASVSETAGKPPVEGQAPKSASNLEQELKSVLDEWVQYANKQDYEAMRAMLTDDYYLFQNGRRYTRDEAIQMISGSRISDIIYSISTTQSGAGGNIAYLTFDIDWHGKVNGIATDAKAMEIYIFRKENARWKMTAKTLMMDAAHK